MEIKNTLGLIGRICSGKSTIAKQLSEHFNIPILSFGAYLLNFSKKHELKTDRDSLQNLGSKFIHENSKLFLENVIAFQPFTSDSILTEGIRHLAIYEELKLMSSCSVFAFIDAPIQIRYERYNKRLKEGDKKISFEDFVKIDNHKVESEIDLLKDKCQIVIDSVNSTNEQILQKFSTYNLH